MPRIRSVKPEFWDDEELADLSRDARLLYIGLWNLADEHSRLRGNPKFIKGKLFPYDDDLDVADVNNLIDGLASAKKVTRYTVGGKPYLFLPNLRKHQRLDTDKVDSKLPSLNEADPIQTHSPDSSEVVRTDPDQSGSVHTKDPDGSALLYGTGSMEHGACTSAPDEPARDYDDGFALEAQLIEPTYEVGSDDDPKWREFWAAYPTSRGKDDARRTYRLAVTGQWRDADKKRKPKADPDALILAAHAHAARVRREGTETKHIKYAQGWLNSDRWREDLEESKSPATAPVNGTAKPQWMAA